ncbi:MAG: SDR family oxidoreductase [Pirellulaceae bacterium]|nr:SDR family oxidoreductase [Pirellulaceae bacterium]
MASSSSATSKVALITGAGRRRVGNVIARRLAARGCDIAVHYNRSADEARETVRELAAMGVRAAAFQADLSREDQIQRLVDETLDRFGRIDVLVTAAAIWEKRQLEDVTADDVRRQFEVNTLGTFLCCQKVGLAMVAQPDGGAIVTIGDWAVERPYVGYAAYFPSKGAIPTMTRSLAVELAARNPKIRVNCVLPGPVMLPVDLPPGERREAVGGTLLKREGSPDHVAQAVEFLVENDYVTGVCLPVDGGRTIA